MAADFATAYDDHVWDVYAFFAYRLGNRSDAEDLTQLTFERALKAWSRFDARKASLRTWLLVIARNLLIDHLRADRSGSAVPIGEDGVSEADLPHVRDAGAALGIDAALAAALAELPQRDREVVALRFGGDLTGPEIAELVDLSLANVQQILSRSLRRLRATLEASGREGTAAGHAERGDG